MDEAAQRLLAGDHRTLSKLITHLEQGDLQATAVLKAVYPHTGRAHIIGITGPPGAGKSTIVDRLTELLRVQGLTVAIIGIDPTSPYSGGALLGDRIRMQRHYVDPGVFIRSVASHGESGGIPRIVRGITRLIDAAGTNIILVETVGIGQTEFGIVDVADTIILALIPESGDAIQALKAGVMEIPDIFLVNKSDREGADQMAAAIAGTIQLTADLPPWTPPIVLTAAHTGHGVEELWEKIRDHREYLTSTSELTKRRGSQCQGEFLDTVEEEMARQLKVIVRRDPSLIAALEDVANKNLEPYSAAMQFIESCRSMPGWPTRLVGDD